MERLAERRHDVRHLVSAGDLQEDLLEVGAAVGRLRAELVHGSECDDLSARDDRDPVNNPGSGLIPGQSEHMANLTGFYENNWISARLAYNYRTQWYDGLSEFGSEMYIDDYGQLDANITISPWENWDFVLEAINMTSEELEYYHVDEERKARLYDNGARYVLGVNYRF